MKLPPTSRWQRFWIGLLLLGWLAVLVGSQLVMPPLLAGAFDGESPSAWLDQKIANHRAYRDSSGLDASREWYVNWAKGYALKVSALTTLGVGTLVALIAFPRARRRVRRFLFASAAPMNLAVLRIAAFGMLLYLLNTERILTYAAWPREMYQWPALAGWFYKFLPITPEVVAPTLTIAIVTTTMAVFGLLTRITTLSSVLLGFYLIGIPQLSGKVNHLHHVLLIGLIVALSRSGDALSLDSIWRAIRRADQGIVAPPRRAVRYGLPIRLAMLVLASVYFFPGFWKMASNGPQWIFSDNLHNHMLQKWFQLEYYVPPIPLHEAPFSGPMGSLFAVVFELGIPLALLWRPTRALWGVMGLTFHNLTNLLMNISFFTLQVMYVMFVDWQRLLAWIGKRFFTEPLRVLYDGNCGLCRRTMGVLGVFDWFQTLRPVNALDRGVVEAEGLGHLPDADLMQDMHVAWREARGEGRGDTAEWKVEKGFAAYQKIAWRVPLLWTTLPFIYLPPIVMLGNRVYRRVADSRACRVAKPPVLGKATRLAWSWKPLLFVAGALLLGQCVLGAGRLHKAWPLACYPLFDQMEDNTAVWPEFEAIGPNGQVTVLDDDPIRDHLGAARYTEAMHRFVRNPLDEADARQVLTEFVPIWQAAGAMPKHSPESIRVDLSTYELIGPQRPPAPVIKEPLIRFGFDQLK